MNKIAILDSGIDSKSSAFTKIINNYTINHTDTGCYIKEVFEEDEIGHGTAVASIIYKNNPNIQIYNFKLFGNKINISTSVLYATLNYINENYENLNIDFINISLGITFLEEYDILNGICNSLFRKKCIIISAFDNHGAISYPAAIESVIGVDVTRIYNDKKDIFNCKNSIVNYLLPDIYYRADGLNNRKNIVKGTSFACAKITGILSKELDNEEKKSQFINNVKKIKKIRSLII